MRTFLLYWSIVLILFISCSNAASCGAILGSSYSHINLSPRPTIDPLSGNDTLGNCEALYNSPQFICFVGSNSPLPLLINGDLGPEGTNYSSDVVHAWNRSAQSVLITHALESPAPTIRHVNLYFYNIPSRRIGLPTVSLYAGEYPAVSMPLEYYIVGNDVLTEDDMMRCNVLLSLVSPPTTRFFNLQFDFENTDIDWLVLSETTLCQFPLQVMAPTEAISLLPTPSLMLSADQVSPNLSISCTVRESGRFSWIWTDSLGNSPIAVTLSDATRTSTALFTGISSQSWFRCEAAYNPQPSQSFGAVSQEIHVDQNDADEAKVIAMESDTVTADILDSVTLSCEMYGYFPEDLPEFRWTVNAWPIDSSHPHYNISTSRGTRLIQNGGNISIPSVISTLSIFVASECMFGMYLCQVQDRFGSPMLLLRSGVGRESTTTASETESSTGCTTDIAVAVVATFVLTLTLNTTILLLVVFGCRHSSTKTTCETDTTGHTQAVYEEVDTIKVDKGMEMEVNQAYGPVSSHPTPASEGAYEL